MRHAQRWSWSTGERGRNRVRVFEHHTTRLLFLEVYEFAGPGKKPRPKRIALGDRDREAAKEKAEALASAIRRAPREGEADVTVRTLFDIYVRERTPQKRSRGSQLHDRLVADLFVRSVGPDRLAKTLNRRDWDRYIRDRLSGALGPDGRQGEPVGNRQVQYDLLTIQAVMNWASTYQETPGRPLLDRNPLKGLEAPHEESPARPLVTAGEYTKLLAVAPSIHPLFELALVVAHETGHRMGAIRLLRWSDIDLSTKHIRWRAENDKIGFEHTVPVSDTTVAALQAARSRQGAIGDAWIFPAIRKPSEPMSRHTLLHWWQRAVTEAKLAPATRRGFHALRRKFATDLRHDLPLKDQAFLGGWKTVRTLADVYQQADDTTMRNALARRRGTEAPAAAIESTPRIHTTRAGT